MNLKPLSTHLPLFVRTGLSKRLFWFAVLSLKSFVGMLSFGFQQLFDTLEELLDKTLRFQTSLCRLGRRRGLGSFVPF
jgi:hypothetical protein